MRDSTTSSAASKKRGSSDSVRKPWAIGPPKGPALARSTSTWIHWWSPVASANWFTCSCVMVIQSLTATSWPTQAARSWSVWNVFLVMRGILARRPAARLSALRQPRSSAFEPVADRLPLRQVALHPARRDVEQREPARRELHVVLGVAQLAQYRHAKAGDELVQPVGRQGAGVHAHAHEADLRLFGAALLLQPVEEIARGVDVEDARLQRH